MIKNVFKRQRLMLQKAPVTMGGCYVVDNLHGLDSAVAVRSRNFIHNGRSDPYSARNCHYSRAGARHSRAVGPVGREIPAWNSSVL